MVRRTDDDGTVRMKFVELGPIWRTKKGGLMLCIDSVPVGWQLEDQHRVMLHIDGPEVVYPDDQDYPLSPNNPDEAPF